LAREDSIIVVFDLSFARMLDDMQHAQMAVTSWPYLPLVVAICHHLVHGDDEGDEGDVV
jgi:hypothetical protein